MKCLLGTPASGYNLPKLRGEALAAWPKLESLNEVNTGTARIGFYFEDADVPTQAAVDSLMAAHTATPLPPTAEETLFSQSVTQLRASFNTARNAAQINNSLDALTVVLRRLYRELQ